MTEVREGIEIGIRLSDDKQTCSIDLVPRDGVPMIVTLTAAELRPLISHLLAALSQMPRSEL